MGLRLMAGLLVLLVLLGVGCSIYEARVETAVFLPLRANRRREQEGSLFTELAGTVQVKHLLPLLAMPLLATAVYGLAAWLPYKEDVIRTIFELTPLAQGLVGAVVFVWAFMVTIRPFHMSKTAAQGKVTCIIIMGLT
jgi:hypothetical protein